MMHKSKERMTACSCLLGLTVCLIWGNSLLGGETSGSISGGFAAWIGKILPFLSPESQYGHLIVRKCAHFSIFFLLGLELRWLFGMLVQRKVFVRCLAVAAAVAAIDESIQRFIPGRYGCITDVMIDICGAAAGILFLYWGILCKEKIKQERT